MDKHEEEVAALYRRYIPMVRSRCRQLLGYRDTVDDVAQEVFVNFIKHRNRNLVADNPGGLLYVMTTRLCMDRLRTAYRRSSVFIDTTRPGEDMARPEPKLDQSAEIPDVDKRLAMEKAMSLLSEEERSVGTSYYVHGLSQLEISESLRMPARTVSRRIEQFRDRMRTLLEHKPTKREVPRA